VGKLSPTQRYFLRQIADRERREKEPGESGASSDSPTNPSGCALKRRELAYFDWKSGRAYGTWRLTDAGRAELERHA
jgi:hypothetical protein